MEPDVRTIVESGQALEMLHGNRGWELVKQYMKRCENEYTRDMLDYRGSDPNVLRSLQLGARMARDYRRNLETFITETINAARQVLIDLAKSEV